MTYCSVVTVLALVGLTGHYAILKILSVRSLSWFNVLQRDLAHLLSDPSLLPVINPQGFA